MVAFEIMSLGGFAFFARVAEDSDDHRSKIKVSSQQSALDSALPGSKSSSFAGDSTFVRVVCHPEHTSEDAVMGAAEELALCQV
jgi:hypothetical protein